MDYRFPFSAKGAIFSILFSLLGVGSILGQTRDTKEQVSFDYEYGNMSTFISEMEADYEAKLKLIGELVKSKNITVTEKRTDGTEIALEDIGTDGTPLFYTTLNDPASQTSRAHTLYDKGLLNLGLSGTQMGVWDSGVALSSHQEFDVRAKNADQANEVSLHATLVTGNLISAGVEPNARGVAYSAEA